MTGRQLKVASWPEDFEKLAAELAKGGLTPEAERGKFYELLSDETREALLAGETFGENVSV